MIPPSEIVSNAIQEFKDATIDEIDTAIALLQNLKVARQKLEALFSMEEGQIGAVLLLASKKGRGRPKGTYLPSIRKGSMRALVYECIRGKGDVKVNIIIDELCEKYGKMNDASLRVSISKVLNNPRDNHIYKVKHGIYSFIE